ncbi:MAG: BACON domain-containing protein [Bacteroidales bacterium]|nr:BACON domain-containing protein [Bacteroidales bacterium]
MKYCHSIQYAAWALLALGAVACQGGKEASEARAVATSETYLTFAAKDAPGQTISVYADGSWAADSGDEWISVSPASGDGPMEVTISVDDNYSGGVMDLPRTGTVLFQGGTALRRGQVTVQQLGDTYKGVQELTVTEVLDLDDATVAKIPSATVAAITTSGFVLTDGTSALYVQGAREVKVGDVVSLNGAKATFHSAPSFLVDELTVTSNGTFTYPTAPDLTDALGSYDGKSVVFGKVSGSLINGSLKAGSATVVVVDPVAELQMDKVDLHKVVLTGYAVGKEGASGYLAVTAVDDNGADDTLVPYPLRWAMGSDLNYSSDTFNNDNPRIDPVQGIGYIEYVPYDLESNNSTNNYKLDVQANNPRVTGPWVNDYWLFYGNGAIKAGTEVQIAFEMRSSKWGMKYWLLEYLDGDEWLVAGTPQTATDPGYEVRYTCATNEDGATNCPVMETIRFRKNNEHLQIRLRCSALWRGGGGTTDTRSTASSRLCVTDVNDDTYKPNIVILKEGDGVEKDPVYADIQTSVDLLTFNGTPTGPKAFTVASDYDFTVSTAYDWLTLDVTEGAAGVETEITVTCAESDLSELREGNIRIVSEDSEKVINVVQSAAGQLLDPFISVSSGNAVRVGHEAGTSTVRIQTNIDVSCASDAAWITVTPVESKALVEWHDYLLTCEANDAEAERTGTVRFFNTSANQEAVVTVTQAAAPASGVYFQDDFSWLMPYVQAFLASDADATLANMDPVGSNLSSHKQPNVWSLSSLATTLGVELENRGYEDLNKSAATLYLQNCYFKMGASNKQTGLRLPPMDFKGDTPVNVVVSFDWCAHKGGSGAIDNVQPVVEVEGPGMAADTETAVSAPFSTTQEPDQLAWQHASVTLVGVTKGTRILIRPVNMGATPQYQRWHLDNIKVEAAE